MNGKELVAALFPAGHTVRWSADIAAGTGTLGDEPVAVIGTADDAAIGVETALALASEVLNVVRSHPLRAIVLLVNTVGQRLTRRDELLGINSYLAHLAQCVELARVRGHRIVSVVYGEAVSGGFLSLGMMADAVYAVAGAQVKVMNLAAMARVMKMPLESLEALSRTSPVFAPGAENFFKLGGIHEIWSGELSSRLQRALTAPVEPDSRRDLAHARGGRLHAGDVSRRAREETPNES